MDFYADHGRGHLGELCCSARSVGAAAFDGSEEHFNGAARNEDGTIVAMELKVDVQLAGLQIARDGRIDSLGLIVEAVSQSVSGLEQRRGPGAVDVGGDPS